jgi:uncharacterized repeat protein (TIGR03803 family)
MKRFVLLCVFVLTCNFAFGQYDVLWSFGSVPNDGAQPQGTLIADRSGDLYGTARIGGKFESGIVFKLHLQPDGIWAETIIHHFCSAIVNNVCTDGARPQAGLVFDSSGNLYGTTLEGGAACTLNSGGCGTAFELSPPGGANPWSETVLYDFCQTVQEVCLDGNYPTSQLTIDSMGNLYGTTEEGGSGHWAQNNGAGTVFEISPGSNGWTHTVLYSFCSLGSGNACPDGAKPISGVTFDAAGNLYGTTENGGGIGGHAYGTVYELSPTANGWMQSVVYSFYAPIEPGAPISFDSAGNLYSTTMQGGIGFGSVFRLSANQTVRSFAFNGTNGDQPYAGVTVNPLNDALYGTTAATTNGGNVFSIGPEGKLTVLYSFCSQPNCTDGVGPEAGLLGKLGKLYGTTNLWRCKQ